MYIPPGGTVEGRLGRVLAVEGSEARVGLVAMPAGAERPTVGKFVAINGHGTRWSG